MRKFGFVLTIGCLFLIALAAAPAALAHQHHGACCGDCQGAGPACGGDCEGAGPACCGGGCDSGSEVRLRGTIDAIEPADCPGGGTGMHLQLRTDEDSIEVHLGPAAFLEDRGFDLAAGDEVEIIGWRGGRSGEEFLVAREIRDGDRVLTLRGRRGRPEWSRGGRGTGPGNGRCPCGGN